MSSSESADSELVALTGCVSNAFSVLNILTYLTTILPFGSLLAHVSPETTFALGIKAYPPRGKVDRQQEIDRPFEEKLRLPKREPNT